MVAYLGRRWRGETSLTRLYWLDILCVGSFLNIFTAFVSLMLVAQGGDMQIAVALHFVMLPYNVFLVVALWRMPQCSKAMAWTSALWLVAMTLI
jgi:hypothetical protein